MRTYPRNSPQAVCRILALAMLADGHIHPSELSALGDDRVLRDLDIDSGELDLVVHAFCEDLMTPPSMHWADVCPLEPASLSALMAEIDDPALRRKLLRVCIAVVEADQTVTAAESLIVGAAVEHWGLHREALESAAGRTAISTDARAPAAADRRAVH